MPFGIRFADIHGTHVVTFPWGERLRILSGPPSRISGVIKLLSLLIVIFGAMESRSIVRRGDWLPGRVLGVAAGLMVISVSLASLSDQGVLSLPYLGGFGYVGFVLCVGLFFNKQIVEARAAQQRTVEMLKAEMDRHHATHEQMRHFFHHDILTTLPNRAGLLDRLKRSLAASRRNGKKLSILLLDIDRFDMVNDTLGHEIGDELLTQVARRLQDQIRDGDCVARISSDEFVIIAAELEAASSACLLFQDLPRAVSAPFEIGGHMINITVSIGVATYPDDGDSVLELLTAADLAVRDAKRKGRGQVQLFQRGLSDEIHQRQRLGNALKTALAEGQFELRYQPQLNASDGRVICMEALIRWRHPTDGVIMPGRFIPVAEEMHLLIEIGGWVIEEACRRLAEWRRMGFARVRVAVNLSAQQLQYSDLPDLVEGALSRHALGTGDLELEITESLLMANPEKSITLLQNLRDLGVRLSIDDFGTGYSSLSYLKLLPIDALKLDRSFVKDIGPESKGAAICAATIGLATNLGLGTVAEGVETQAQADFLRHHGCELLQGYLFAKPLSPKMATVFLKQNDSR